ncbi:MAG: helix-turn-helix transcriptional regulator [Acidobacteriota bacterium]
MASSRTDLPDELLRLLPLTPAVFYTLFALAEGDRHGYAIMQQSKLLSGGSFRMGPGTLYSTIQRLLELALIEETREPAGMEDSDSRRRYYRLTRTGKSLLELDLARMRSAVRLASDMKLAPES